MFAVTPPVIQSKPGADAFGLSDACCNLGIRERQRMVVSGRAGVGEYKVKDAIYLRKVSTDCEIVGISYSGSDWLRSLSIQGRRGVHIRCLSRL